MGHSAPASFCPEPYQTIAALTSPAAALVLHPAACLWSPLTNSHSAGGPRLRAEVINLVSDDEEPGPAARSSQPVAQPALPAPAPPPAAPSAAPLSCAYCTRPLPPFERFYCAVCCGDSGPAAPWFACKECVDQKAALPPHQVCSAACCASHLPAVHLACLLYLSCPELAWVLTPA